MERCPAVHFLLASDGSPGELVPVTVLPDSRLSPPVFVKMNIIHGLVVVVLRVFGSIIGNALLVS
jgi:hypothetical protein